jgi:hypothetical protein
MPPDVWHEIANPSKTDEACFLLVQASQESFDYVPAPFRTVEAALPFSRGAEAGMCWRRTRRKE